MTWAASGTPDLLLAVGAPLPSWKAGIIRVLSETFSPGRESGHSTVSEVQGLPSAGNSTKQVGLLVSHWPLPSLGEGARSGNTIACGQLGFWGRLVATFDLLSQPGSPCSPAGIRLPSCAPSLGPRATGKLGFTGCLLRKPGDTRCAGGPGSDFADRRHLGAFQISRDAPQVPDVGLKDGRSPLPRQHAPI